MKLVQQTRSAALFAILYLALPICALADDARDEIKKCARIADDSVRIACYEELGSRILGERATDSHADGIVPAGDRVEDDSEVPVAGDTLADGFGGEEFARKTQDYEAANRGRVTSCRQGPDRKWSFFFESGQIWKQSDGRRHRFRECNYLVTITKDTFGYKMQIEGDDRKYRIRRTR